MSGKIEDLDDEDDFDRAVNDMTEFVDNVHYFGDIQPWERVAETADDDVSALSCRNLR